MANMMPGSYNQYGGAFRLVRFDSMLPYPYTMHEHFELFYIKKGSITLTIDDVTVTLHEGDLSLTVPFVFHKNELAPTAVVEMMNIAPYICSEAAQVFGNKRPLRPYLRSNEISPLVRELLTTIPSFVKELQPPKHYAEVHSTSYAFSRDRCSPIQAYLTVLLLELSHNMPLVEINERNITTMQKVLKYCTANFNQEITRHSVSRDCNVSLGMISQTFNRLGTSFRDYVNTLRINRAYQLLTTTKKPITEIIYECGYSNQGTFNRNFQLQFGKSPRDVRHRK